MGNEISSPNNLVNTSNTHIHKSRGKHKHKKRIIEHNVNKSDTEDNTDKSLYSECDKINENRIMCDIEKLETYRNTINNSKDELDALLKDNTNLESTIAKLNLKLLLTKHKVRGLKTIYHVDNNIKINKSNLKRLGIKQYKLIYNKYKDKLKIINLQQNALDKLLTILSDKEVKNEVIKNKIKEVENNTNKNTRIINYKDEMKHDRLSKIPMYKWSATIIILIIIILLAFKIKKNY